MPPLGRGLARYQGDSPFSMGLPAPVRVRRPDKRALATIGPAIESEQVEPGAVASSIFSSIATCRPDLAIFSAG